MQWRIQDFPKVGAPTLREGGAKMWFCQIFPKNCMKFERIWILGVTRLSHPLISATAMDN